MCFGQTFETLQNILYQKCYLAAQFAQAKIWSPPKDPKINQGQLGGPFHMQMNESLFPYSMRIRNLLRR